MEKYTYILAYKHTPQRLKALFRQLDWVKAITKLEIILIEVGQYSQLEGLNLGVKHKFVRTDFGNFNKAWAFNVGLNFCKTPYVIFGDCDIIMDYQQFFEAARMLEKYEVVSPHNRIIDLDQQESRLPDDEIFKIQKMARGEDKTGEFTNICSGIIMAHTKTIYKVGGWYESFEGWGGEDDAFGYILEKVTPCLEFKYSAYHLWHPRAFLHPVQYRENLRTLKELKNLDTNQMATFLNENAKNIGKLNKYR